uniref:Uncharacterized protein n=1 Tax=Labrus bergylta TaxID=56723 RepID=A0A3Q3EES5_9LABR
MCGSEMAFAHQRLTEPVESAAEAVCEILYTLHRPSLQQIPQNLTPVAAVDCSIELFFYLLQATQSTNPKELDHIPPHPIYTHKERQHQKLKPCGSPSAANTLSFSFANSKSIDLPKIAVKGFGPN